MIPSPHACSSLLSRSFRSAARTPSRVGSCGILLLLGLVAAAYLHISKAREMSSSIGERIRVAAITDNRISSATQDSVVCGLVR